MGADNVPFTGSGTLCGFKDCVIQQSALCKMFYYVVVVGLGMDKSTLM